MRSVIWGMVFPLLMLVCQLSHAETTRVNAPENDVKKISVCVTEDDWPPYVFLDSDSADLKGASIDAIHFVFKKIGMPYEVKSVVWTRLVHLKEKARRVCDVIWDITEGTAKEKGFKFSVPLYRTNIVVLFNEDLFSFDGNMNYFPMGVLTAKKTKLCAIRGHNYEMLTPFIDVMVNDTSQALELLGKSRCTLFFASWNVVEFGFKNRIYTLPKNVGYTALPSQYSTTYYATITKETVLAEALLEKINRIVQASMETGEWAKLFEKYGVQDKVNSTRIKKNKPENMDLKKTGMAPMHLHTVHMGASHPNTLGLIDSSVL